MPLGSIARNLHEATAAARTASPVRYSAGTAAREAGNRSETRRSTAPRPRARYDQCRSFRGGGLAMMEGIGGRAMREVAPGIDP